MLAHLHHVGIYKYNVFLTYFVQFRKLVMSCPGKTVGSQRISSLDDREVDRELVLWHDTVIRGFLVIHCDIDTWWSICTICRGTKSTVLADGYTIYGLSSD